jgi:hypothetical protein
VLKTHLPKDFITTKINLDNYDNLTDPRNDVQNIRNSIELVIQDTNAMWKTPPTTFRGSAKVWYESLELGSILDFFM